MARWIAIGRASGWDDLKKFSAEMKDTSQWRVDQKTTITSVYALGDGRMVHSALRRGGISIEQMDAADDYVARLRAQCVGVQRVVS